MTNPDTSPGGTGPVMIAAFSGWNDAAEAASGAVSHLAKEWQATPLGEIDPEDFYDFQVNRPTIVLSDGARRSITWPTTRFLKAQLPNGRDVVLVRGVEPNMRWRGFCAELLTVCREMRVELIMTLAALLADSPHTRPVPVIGSTSDAALQRALRLEISRYEGPTGIVGVFQDACATAGIPAVSFWASVPYYVGQAPCPKATLALLRRVEDVLDVAVPLRDLPEEARAWQDGVDALAAQDSEVAEYVRSLEEAKDTADLPEASGEAIAREFERYLRRRDEGPGDQGPAPGGAPGPRS
jgi:predicted ATP-grasp superfamily ATP-dependent carboligase